MSRTWKRLRSSARSMASADGAEDRHARFDQHVGELERRLAAELHDDAGERAFRLFDAHDFQHVFRRQRFEIEPVGGVVIGRDGFRIAIDHDGLETPLRKRERRVAAAIVELDALADAVGSAAEDDDLLLVGRAGFAFRRAADRRLIGRIHVRRERREFRGAGVDALEHGPHAELATRSARTSFSFASSAWRAARRKSPCAFRRRKPSASCRQSVAAQSRASTCRMASISPRNHGSYLVIAAISSIGKPKRIACAATRNRSGVVRASAARIAFGSAGRSISSSPVKPGFQRAQRLLQRLREGAADRHRFADGFHRGGEQRLGAGEFLEGEARDLRHDIVDGRLERRPA